MKVVLFCGGLGMRLRDYSEQIPKPMVDIGYRPIIWYLMKYYSHYGHKDFILCLGYRADYIKNYFLQYNECLSNDFVMTSGGNNLNLVNRDISDWTISFVDTGFRTSIGGRLLAVKSYLESEDVFLANYTDNLSDVDLGKMTEEFLRRDTVAGFVCVKPNFSFHIVRTDSQNSVESIENARDAELWSNGGFFILRKEIFDYLEEGEELVEEPFKRLIKEGKLFSYKHDGFWACMDTFKEKEQLEDLFRQGDPPWQVWGNR